MSKWVIVPKQDVKCEIIELVSWAWHIENVQIILIKKLDI